MKFFINTICKCFIRKVPTLEPVYPISKNLLELEEYFLRSCKAHPSRFYKDGNFPNFIHAVTKTVVYLAETDSHYRGMLSILFLQVTKLAARDIIQRKPLSEKEYLSWLSGQEICEGEEVKETESNQILLET